MPSLGRVAVLALSALTLARAGTNEVGKKFLEENKAREGVITTKTGLQYKVLKKGEGKYHPTKDSPCECHYAGTTPSLTPDAIEKPEAEWTEFDSSYKRGEPTTFAPNQVIKGWTEAMQLMVEGDKWEMYIPSELGYGDGGSGAQIKGGDVLIFRMEILKITGDKKKAIPCDVKTKENCDPVEIKAIDAYGDHNIPQLLTEVKNLKKQMDGVLKAGEREVIKDTITTIKRLVQKKKKEHPDQEL